MFTFLLVFLMKLFKIIIKGPMSPYSIDSPDIFIPRPKKRYLNMDPRTTKYVHIHTTYPFFSHRMVGMGFPVAIHGQ